MTDAKINPIDAVMVDSIATPRKVWDRPMIIECDIEGTKNGIGFSSDGNFSIS